MPVNNITGLSGNQAQRAEGSKVQVQRNEPTASQEQTGRPSTMDTVSLTDTASRMHKLENTIAKLPVVDSQKVQDVQKALEEGTFDIDPERIAQKMLDFESDLSR